MGQYGIFLHDAAERGIPKQAIIHDQSICAEINGTRVDKSKPERAVTSSDGITNIYINDQRANHWFYWDPANPKKSGANSAHRFGDPVNEFWADILFP